MTDSIDANITSSTEESAVIVTTWYPIWTTAVVSCGCGAVLLLFFLWRRRVEYKNKDTYSIFESRQYTRAHRSPPPFDGGVGSLLGWAKSAYAVTDEQFLAYAGLDAFMLLRFLRLSFRLALLGTIMAAALIPLYATGEERGPETENFNRITLARVSANSNRLWGVLACWILFILVLLRELWLEWRVYATHRYEFLAHGDVDTPDDFRYVVRVENIPKSLRTNHEIGLYFEQMFPHQVSTVSICLYAGRLNTLMNERTRYLKKYEHVDALIHAHPNKKQPYFRRQREEGKCCQCLPLRKVPKTQIFTEEITRLNDEIDRERAKLYKLADGIDDLQVEKFINDDDDQEVKTNPQQQQDGADDDSGDEQENDAQLQHPLQQVKSKSFVIPKEEIEELQKEETPVDGRPSSTAFVALTSLRAKQYSVQCEISGKKGLMEVFPAADPSTIIWDNVTVPLTQQRVSEWFLSMIFVAGILFWAIPITFTITSLANLNGLLVAFGVEPIDSTTFWYGVVTGILPAIALQLLEILLWYAIQFGATHVIYKKSMDEVEAFCFHWYQLFSFADLWFITIGGSLFNQLNTILNNPTAIFEIIAQALPGASTFFVNFILVEAFVMLAWELSLLPTFGFNLISSICCVFRNQARQTQRQLDKARQPPSLSYGSHLPRMVFVFLVTIMYMPIVPIMEFGALIYFGASYIVMKHQCLHVYSTEHEGGGVVTWQHLFSFLMASIYMAEGSFIAYMGLKEAVWQFALGFIPLVLTVIFHYTLVRNVQRPLANLALAVAAEIDVENGHRPIDKVEGSFSACIDRMAYGQPTLKLNGDQREPLAYRRPLPRMMQSSNTSSKEEEKEVADETAAAAEPVAA